MGFCCKILCSVLSSLLISLTSLSINLSHAADTLTQGQSIQTNQTLISAGGTFELGFFSPGGNSTGRRYVGIWYHNISTCTVVWVANRENPLTNSAGSLTVGADGRLAVLDGSGRNVVWTSNSSVDWSNSTVAQLKESGNLVLRSGNGSGTVLWESFDHPTDTFVPGMKISTDLTTKVGQRFVSWRSPDDPAPGDYSLGLDPLGSAQMFIWAGPAVRWRSGPWNKQSFIGITRMRPLSIYGFQLDPNVDGKMVLRFAKFNTSRLRFVMQWDGIENTSIWVEDANRWNSIWLQPLTDCETYNHCGSYGLCSDAGTPECSCLKGFEPKSVGEWSSGNWSSGCVRRTPLGCSSGRRLREGFWKLDGLKLPDFSEWASTVTDETGCAAACLSNCSCTAHAYVDGIGCMTWGRDLVDVAQFPGNGGYSLYIKLAGSELVSDGKNNLWIILVVVASVLVAIILFICFYLWWKCNGKLKDWWKKRREIEVSVVVSGLIRREAQQEFSGPRELEEEANEGKGADLPMFSFDIMAAATDNFSDSNKLGEGGFGHVYKGMMPGGEEVAVKRLSRSSGQGPEEFKNEVILIAKLQHRNLVRLLGCCIQGEEKILIYEYMPNKSLDAFLFNPTKQPLLDWRKRFDIIEGVARGLLYLHRDSRLRIVHRDLKASNILLDEEMNPKISDFGIARIFGGNQNQDNTNRVVGTFGYMSPEYAMEGLFSVKSDVYSFGVLILEITSGRKNSRTRSENYTNLIGYAWQLWTEDRVIELIDPSLRGRCPTQELLRCIHIGLLCVQDRAFDRPTMSSVVIMLGSETPIHQTPKQPTFAAEGSPSGTGTGTDSQKHNHDDFSVNDVTITVLTGR